MYCPRSIPLPAGAEQEDAITFSNGCATGRRGALVAKSLKQIRLDGKLNRINAHGYFVGSCIVLCAVCSVPVQSQIPDEAQKPEFWKVAHCPRVT
jgi:hypothetical protein